MAEEKQEKPKKQKRTPQPMSEADRLKKQEYQRRYYEQNKTKLLEERKRRYQEDPEYHALIRKATKDSKIRRRVGISRREIGVVDGNHRGPRIAKRADGSFINVYSLGYVADVVDYAASTLYQWQKHGALPKPTLVDDSGRKWFSKAWIEQFVELLKKFRAEAWKLDQFGKFVKENWKPITE